MKKIFSALLIISILISMFAISATTTTAATTDGLPDVVDNSTSKYFPPIKSQGSQGSCVAWSQAYYQFTYEMNKSLDRESTEENCFSPTFTYNMSNYGEDVGCFPNNTYSNMKKIGVAPLSLVPFTMEEHRNWYAQEDIWREASKYRVDEVKVLPNFRTGSGKQVTHPDDTDITEIKTLLNNGHILSFGAYINRWKTTTIKANASCPENDAYVGQAAVKSTSPDIGNGYGHRMTIVGYNDNIWIDVNGNNSVDNGEMGAFKIANSWGPWWKNDGFIWFAYDNINMETAVDGGLPYRVMSGMIDITKISVLPYNSDTDMYIRYTLNTSDRQNTVVTITAEKDGKTYEVVAGPHHESPYLYNHYSFDGTTNSNDGTMIFMLSNVVPDITSDTINDYKWSIKFEDTESDSVSLTVKNAEIVDKSTDRVAKPQGAFEFKLNGTSKTLIFPKLSVSEKALYYKGFDTPHISYTDAKGNKVSDAMTVDSSSEKYTHKYVFKNGIQKDTTVIFSDGDTLVDDNNGNGYVLDSMLNYCTTQYETEIKYIGDTDNSGEVNILDATHLQKHLAALINTELDKETANANGDSSIDITDANCIQRYLAGINGGAMVGKKITRATFTTTITSKDDDNTVIEPQPDIPPVDEPENPVVTNQVTFTNSLNWSGTIYCYYWSDSNSGMVSWPGVKMTKSGTNEFNQSIYTFDVPDGANRLIFSNGSNQTVDITYSGGEIKYYALNTKTGNGYNVETW